MNVLVVDGNRSSRFVLMGYLRSWGCLPVEAPSDQVALSILKNAASLKNPFDVIITESLSPELNGFDLAKEIRSIESLESIPIIMLTDAGMKGDSKKCKQLGINGYLTKPLKLNDLRSAIESTLGRLEKDKALQGMDLITRHTIAEDRKNEIQILLAEDYPTNQQVALRHLKQEGYQVDLAENGQQAVEAFQRNYYDLILMDIQMPVMDGFEATQQIRKLEKTSRNTGDRNVTSEIKKMPIIAMTAHAMKGYKEKCINKGMNDYISKPIKRNELYEIIDKWIHLNPNDA